MRNQTSFGADAPRHPFRQSLSRPKVTRNEDGDLKLFVLSFTAFFVCIYSFIF